MQIEMLLKKLEGPMSQEWQECRDYIHCYESKRTRLEDQFKESGKELCSMARRKLKSACQKYAVQKWCAVHIVGPGYILHHGGPVAIRKPYIQFCVSIGNNSELRYNHWPQSESDIDAVCQRLAKAVAVLTKPISNARVAR